ncbi:MAG: signal peptidase I, partial [Methanobrevibacter sp.]|nr:signal peptidase I [Methanobrevibacter sp.]
DDIKVGDIVVYNAAWHEGPVIHRVINIAEINGSTVFEIKGDNNDVSDPYWVTKSQIKSRVLTFDGQPIIIPKIGYISIWIRGL